MSFDFFSFFTLQSFHLLFHSFLWLTAVNDVALKFIDVIYIYIPMMVDEPDLKDSLCFFQKLDLIVALVAHKIACS